VLVQVALHSRQEVVLSLHPLQVVVQTLAGLVILIERVVQGLPGLLPDDFELDVLDRRRVEQEVVLG
jgi:hypothetical protein